jgi:P4 family phage/plasmid primase-like protien
MFLSHFTSPFQQTLHPEGAPFFTANGCTGRRLKSNLTHINAIFADWDFKPKDGEPTGSGKPDFKQFMLDLDELPTPTFVVESGNGWHVYWLLNEPIVVTDDNRETLIEQVEGIHRHIHEQCGSDSGAMDVLHLMRLPGHEHRKQPKHPFLVDVVIDNSDTRYTLEELLESIPPVYKDVLEYENDSKDDFDIKQVVIDVWKEKGDEVTFDEYGRMIWNGESTGTFIGREGKRNYIATTSQEYPYRGNPTTYVSGVLGITTKEAYKWLINKYGEPVGEMLGSKGERLEEREAYLEHLSERSFDNQDWVKELKKKSDRYFINFYKRIAQLYPHLKYEIGRVDTFWNYDSEEGVYVELAQPTLAGIVIRALREDEMDNYTTDSQVKRIILNFTAYEERGVTLDSFSLPDGWLHVKNGWLNLTTLALLPHSPERLSLFKMDTDYEPQAECPMYDKFLDVDVQMPSDQVRVIDQFSGYILTNSIKQHTCLIFEGRKGCGKSMLAEIWMDMLGKKAIPLQLTALQNGGERFIGQTLAHKNMVWFDEANPKTTNINEFFQNLITGEKIRIERKGVQGDDYVKNTMKVVLSLNEMPDHMPVGMDRRYRHILFHRSFYEEGMVDPDYKEKLLASEKSGVLNRMLRGLDDLNKMGHLTMMQGEEERKREYALTSDDFSSFLSDHFEPVPVSDTTVRYSYSELRDAFVVEYPKGYNKQLTVRGFNKKLLSTRLPEFKNLTTGKSDGVRGYKGIVLKTGHEISSNKWEPIMVRDDSSREDF